MSSHWSIKRIVAVVYKAGLYGLPVAFVMALIHGTPADALTNQPISPIRSDMINQSSNNGEGRINHVLKRETSSTISRLDLVAYYDGASVSPSRTITISDRDSHEQRCHTYTSGNIPGFVRVTLSIDPLNPSDPPSSSSRKVTYRIRSDRVCNNGSPNNTLGNLGGARFFGTYQVPTDFRSGVVPEDDAGSHLYKLYIRIEYVRNSTETALSSDVLMGNNSNKQQVTFKVRLDYPTGPTGCAPDTPTRPTCTRYIGVLPSTTGTPQNYSTLGPYENLSGDVTQQQYYTQQLFKFGLPCTQTTPSGRLSIYVYDVDNQNAWRNVNISVQSSPDGWATPSAITTLREGIEYDADASPPPAALNVTNGGRTITPTGVDKSSVRIQLHLQPSVNYRIVVRNVHFRNLIGVGLPGPTIFGDLSCAYSLTPGVGADTVVLSPGEPVRNIRGTVANNGIVASNTTSAVVRYVIPSAIGGGTPGGGTVSSIPNAPNSGCTIAHNVAPGGGADCREFGRYTGTFPSGVTTTFWTGDDNLADADVNPGDRVCYMTVVNNHNQAATVTDWRYSASYCILVAKLPFVQVWGNDLRVGGRYASDGMIDTDKAAIRASLMRFDGRYYGSWTEYGVLAPGQVTGMASGYGLAEGQTSNNQADWSGLTFAQTTAPDPNCPTGFGCFTTGEGMGTLPDVSTGNSAFDVITKTPIATINAQSDYDGSRIWHNTGDIEITGNITATPGPYSSEAKIPQRIIIARNINIRSNVTRIDAWLVATDAINTCSDVPGNLTVDTCNEPLVINGPTIAKTLVMRRTAGADSPATARDPAEQFNLRGDTYIWAYNQAQRTGTIRTSYVRELAPRY